MSFSDLKKQSKLGSLTSKLVREVEKMNTTSGGDDRLWKPEVDKSGNGYAVIRFLPAPEGEDIPWVKMYSHAFQGPGGWYMENSLTTLGSPLYHSTAFDPFESTCRLPPPSPGPGGKSINKDLPLPLDQVDNGVL